MATRTIIFIISLQSYQAFFDKRKNILKQIQQCEQFEFSHMPIQTYKYRLSQKIAFFVCKLVKHLLFQSQEAMCRQVALALHRLLLLKYYNNIVKRYSIFYPLLSG